ncbi:MAG: transglutaminase-like domain-containing protein [Pseudomonadota bacterium]
MAIHRRQFLLLGVTLSATIASAEPERAGITDSPNDWLASTPFIDSDHPAIRTRSYILTEGLTGESAKVLAVFHFVRDQVKFGFTGGFWHNKASEVLASGVGYCNTKSTLFIALLRAANIPARQVFVDLDSSVLHGIVDTGTPYVDHSYVELFLNDQWVQTNSYIVDHALFAPAQRKAKSENRLLGYGVHQTGSMDFDGVHPSYSQFNVLDPRPISPQARGVFADVGDFYNRTPDSWNKLNGVLRFGFGVLSRAANRRADQIRRSG